MFIYLYITLADSGDFQLYSLYLFKTKSKQKYSKNVRVVFLVKINVVVWEILSCKKPFRQMTREFCVST